MPIYELPDVSGSRHDDYLPNIERFRTMEELGTSIHFNEEKPLDNIRQYISGMRWEVDYFNQYQGTNEDNNSLDLNVAVTNQSYIRIHKLILFVNNALNQGPIRDLTGSALINAEFTPYKGDHFLTTLVGGRIALFTITEVTKNDYNLHQVYEVQYKLERNLNEEPEVYNNLISKVVRNYVYNNEAGIDGNSKLLTREEMSLVNDIKSAIDDLTDYFFRTFMDPETKFLKLPTKSNTGLNYVDQELGKFCRAVLSVDDYHNIVEIQTIDYTMDKSVRYTIWDAILKRDPRIITRAEPMLGFTRAPYPRGNLNSLEPRWMDVDYIIDKVQAPLPSMAGVEDTRTVVDPRVSVYQILKAIHLTDAKNTETAKKTWELIVPGLDFTTIVRNVPELRKPEEKPAPQPEPPVYPKKHDESEPKESVPNLSDKEACDQCVKEKVEEMEKKEKEKLGIKEEEKKEEKKEDKKLDLSNLNPKLPGPNVPNKPKVVEEVKPVIQTAGIQPIKSTKQYQRFAAKKDNP